MNGVINIFKNKGMTSFDVVKNVRRISKEKKVGHTGTLDPEAIGVLPVCLGKATKIIDYIMDSEKTYVVKFELGIVTDTYDLEGKIISQKDTSNISSELILDTINSFVGSYNQVPPMYSALKKNGVRLYELARQGIEVERESRLINIYSIEDISISKPFVEMKVKCSKGTYIRSLCYDIGQKLNVGATMVSLKRSGTACFYEEDSINIDALTEENIEENLISIEDALSKYPKLFINKGFSKLIINGVRVADRRACSQNIELNKLYRVYDEDKRFIGLGRKNEMGIKLEKLLI